MKNKTNNLQNKIKIKNKDIKSEDGFTLIASKIISEAPLNS